MSSSKQVTTEALVAVSPWKVLFQGISFPVLVFCVHQISVVLTAGEYWWDEPMHAAGGAAIVWLLLHVHQVVVGEIRDLRWPHWYVASCLIAGALAVGVVWEWYEYLRWITVDPGMDLTLVDTLKDLVMDALGALVGVVLFVRSSRSR